ncbi:hypothetical protein GOODEAATRI_026712 [Goodea atripinnis]|uniref:Uncharacterized protein n=1 Tax=Goodea atripinnis TaxID=208336 RepID=A0ABV0NNG8_9TELE
MTELYKLGYKPVLLYPARLRIMLPDQIRKFVEDQDTHVTSDAKGGPTSLPFYSLQRISGACWEAAQRCYQELTTDLWCNQGGEYQIPDSSSICDRHGLLKCIVLFLSKSKIYGAKYLQQC